MGRKKIYESREEYYKQYYAKNKEKALQNSRKWKEENPDKVKKHWENFKSNSDKYKTASKKWNSENRDRINELLKEKRKQDPKFRLRESILALINHHLQQKSKSTNEYLGCSYEEYHLYLENKFKNQMNWNNYGTYWEIDHTIPLSKGGSFHYTNTSPMTITENRQKSNKL